MAIFPLVWLAAAVVAALCVVAGFDEVLLVQGIATFLYLLTLIRWRRRSRARREAVTLAPPMDQPEITNDLDMLAEFHAEDSRFGGGAPDDLQRRLLRKAIQMEERKLRLQVATL